MPTVKNVLNVFPTHFSETNYPEEIDFNLERTITINTYYCSPEYFIIDMAEPMNVVQNNRQIQTVYSINYSQDVYKSTRYGHNWIEWVVDAPSIGEYNISIEYAISTKAAIWEIDSKISGDVSDISIEFKDQYLHDEWVIQIDDPSIIDLSYEIVGDETNTYIILENIYNWVKDNIEYSTESNEPQNAVESVNTLRGDCDDQSILFCSLARAAGIPAWLQLGVMYSDMSDAWGGHAWIQAYVPFKGGGGKVVTIDIVNNEFMEWNPNRFIEYTSDGNAEHLRDYYYIYNGTKALIWESYNTISYDESGCISQHLIFEIKIIPDDMLLTLPRIRVP
ncbi:MAG: transglutaminase domain-containing protein [Euryarchaeota archaeon]|nr:transglutaminase domain-containing protein [Euryarchaeota archaeon]